MDGAAIVVYSKVKRSDLLELAKLTWGENIFSLDYLDHPRFALIPCHRERISRSPGLDPGEAI